MSRRRSTSSAVGPPSDRDVAMGPPLAPTPTSGSQKGKDTQDINEKYRKLKRRFFELEEKHKETSTELQRSGERNVKMREERNILLDRIIELETDNQPYKHGSSSVSPPDNMPMAQPISGAYPRTLLNARARPETRRRSNGERRERLEGEAREHGQNTRRTRSSHVEGNHSGGESSIGVQDHDSPGATRKTRASSSGHIASQSDRLTPPSSHSESSSRSNPRLSPLPSKQSHSHPYPHPPPTPPSRFSQHNHYSHQRQSLSPDLDDNTQSSPGSEMDVDTTTDQGRYDYSPLPSYNNRTSGSKQNQDYVRDHHGNENTEPNISDRTVDPVSQPSNGHETATIPSRRENARPRRGGKNVELPEPEPVHRTRASMKRGATSSVGTRLTRSESAALAAAKPNAIPESEAPSHLISPLRDEGPSSNLPSTDSPESTPPSSSVYQDASTRSAHGVSAIATPIQPEVPSRHPSDSSLTSQEATPLTGDETPIDPAILSASAQQKSEASAKSSSKEPSSMVNIVKVAEAAVAAQNAANAAKKPASTVSPTSGQTQTPGASSSSAPSPTVTTPTTTQFGTNPYMVAAGLGVANAVKPTITTMGPGIPTMIAHPLAMNPYAMYYTPSTPVTPNTPTYPHPYANPYYYLAAPMASPNGLYPASPTFVPPSTQRPPSEVQRQAKPKRLKAHTVTSKNFSIPMVPRDKRGKPMLPLNVGIMTVINLGDVCMREHFHTERYIFPVGYEVTRRYLSTVDPTVEVVYHCTILDGGDGPKFQIVPSDVPDRPVIAGTATGAWSNIVKQANAIRNRQHSNSVSGPDFFGLGQNTIKHLIQELPNADRLRDYVWQNFVEGGPLGGRHAAVIPALPEEYDASMPIGAYYPSEREKMKRAGVNADAPRGISHYPQHIIAQAEAERAQQQALAQAQQQNPQQHQSGLQQPNQPGGTQASMTSSSESTNTQNTQQTGSSRTAPAGGVGRTSDPGPSSASSHEHSHNTRSTSQSQPPPPGGLPHSPYVATSNPPLTLSTSAPAVPATFASIMNAYPAPGTGPNE